MLSCAILPKLTARSTTARNNFFIYREPSETEHVERSKSYLAWYTFWYNHFNSMSKEEYDQFVDDKFSGKDISKYMPKGSWKDTYTEDVKKH